MKVKKKYVLIILFILIWSISYFKSLNNEASENVLKQDVSEETHESIKMKIDGRLNIYYFNVGQADSILVENNDKYMLIDAGNNADGLNIVNYMKNMGINKVEHLVATHAHEDHIGGMDDIINNFVIDNFYMPDVITTTKTFEDVITALENNNVKFNVPNIGDKFMLGGCMFEILHLSDDDSDLNDTSIVMRGVYGENSFLFMGDATSNVEKNILKKNIDSDVLKVGHHGSKYSSMISFLNKVSPTYSIISVGYDNSYEHPHGVTLTNLNDVGSKVYRTDVDGTILVSSDGENIEIEKLKVNLNG